MKCNCCNTFSSLLFHYKTGLVIGMGQKFCFRQKTELQQLVHTKTSNYITLSSSRCKSVPCHRGNDPHPKAIHKHNLKTIQRKSTSTILNCGVLRLHTGVYLIYFIYIFKYRSEETKDILYKFFCAHNKSR